MSKIVRHLSTAREIVDNFIHNFNSYLSVLFLFINNLITSYPLTYVDKRTIVLNIKFC